MSTGGIARIDSLFTNNYSFILANTEELHTKIAEMSDRIQQLEDAVAMMQPSLSSEPHPLLHPDLLRIKSSAELHRAQMTGGTKSASSPPGENSEGEPATNHTPSAFPFASQEHAYEIRAAPDVSTALAPNRWARTNSAMFVRLGQYYQGN